VQAPPASIAAPQSLGSRRQAVRRKLATIEATKGGQVSSFLTDSFGREHDYLRISLTEKCNLRCTYCMPDEGAPLSPKENLLTTDEIVRLAGLFVQNGVKKIRLTGGEPTVRKDLVEIVERLSALGLESLGMTSNGIALSRKLPALVQAGLTHLNISLDTLDEHKFELMTRRRGHKTVLGAIAQASELLPSGAATTAGDDGPRLQSLKLNVVVINNVNSDEVLDFVALTRDTDIAVRFIEYMPFDGNKWSTKKLVASADLLEKIATRYGPAAQRAGLPGSTSGQGQGQNIVALTPGNSDTARTYRVEGHKGSFGFISSMTDNFCSGCSRLRMGADGSMKVCLFGEPNISLRDLLRSGASDSDMMAQIGIRVKGKHFKHDGKSGPSDIATHATSPMVLIGG